MSHISMSRRNNQPPSILEFFGLPGSGKSTVANHLADLLRERGYEVQMTTDFVLWLSKQTKLRKLGYLISRLNEARRQLFWCMLFGLRLSPLTTISLSKIVRIPFINACFDHYLENLDNAVVIMDQANMQLIWSVGAFSTRYDKTLLHRACKATIGVHPRRYACLTSSIELISERIKARASTQSRFDNLSDEQLGRALANANRIISDLYICLEQEDYALIDVDASVSPEENAKRLCSLLLKEWASPRTSSS